MYKKKKRSKGLVGSSGPGSGGSQEANTEPPPPRITKGNGVSVRSQIQLVNRLKQPAATTPKYRQTYRKPGLDPEQLRREAEERAKQEAALKLLEAKKVSQLSCLRNIYNTANNFNPPVVLVDAYNVLHEWARLRLPDDDMVRRKQLQDMRAHLQAGHLDTARQLLIGDLEEYSMARAVKVIAVFDAMDSLCHLGNPRVTSKGGIDIVFCSRCEADTYIMMEVSKLVAGGRARQVLVASSDAELFQSGWGGGAAAIPSSLFLQEVEKARRETKYVLKDMEHRAYFGRVGQEVYQRNPELYGKLAALRKSL
ncbi:hypothetical protein WJX72_011065 [[Myrmecia] bisecta]|uniref:NYN domain-containing protein n=1 Tax=[Myrmecia] bisecta TaxID=41462 RepID=A0AAW1P607_9CHLO